MRLDDAGEAGRGPIGPIAADSRGRLVVSAGGDLRLAETPDRSRVSPLAASPVLLRLPAGLRVQALSVRSS